MHILKGPYLLNNNKSSHLENEHNLGLTWKGGGGRGSENELQKTLERLQKEFLMKVHVWHEEFTKLWSALADMQKRSSCV